MSVRILSSVWDRAQYEGPAFVVLLALADWADDEGRCYPSITKLARKARLGLTATKSALKRLRSDGVLDVETAGNSKTSNRYRLLVESMGRSPGDLGRETTTVARRPRVGRETTEGGSPDDLGVGRETAPIRHRSVNEPSIKPSTRFVLPASISETIWADYEEMRRKLKRPLTPKARELAVKEILKLQAAGYHPQEVIEQSILNSWQGLFPVRSEQSKGAMHAVATSESSPDLATLQQIARAESERSEGASRPCASGMAKASDGHRGEVIFH
jgi:hypothetical protein